MQPSALCIDSQNRSSQTHESLADMKQACPAEAAEIVRLGQSFAVAKMISDPAHDRDSMKRWIGTLAAEQIADLEKTIKEQKAATRT